MNGSDRDIAEWDKRLGDQALRGWDNHKRNRIYLDTAKSIKQWIVVGEFLYVEKVSSKSALATLRLNREKNDPIDLELGTVIKTIFCRLFITNTAQAGEWIDVITGINFEYYKQNNQIAGAEAQQVLNLTHVDPDTDVAAAAHVCNEALIKADVKNTQTAWIDFGTAAVQDDCLPLDPGEWIREKVSNTDRIHANFEVGGELVFIVYEV